MKTLLIVYHAMTGGTQQMAEAAAGAAREQTGVDVRLQRADATSADDVLAADAYLFATPENLAAMSGLMKDFFDRCYYAALDRVNPPVCGDDLRGKRRAKRAAPDRPDRDRVAFEERGAGPDRLYARADAGTHPRGEDDRRRRSRALRQWAPVLQRDSHWAFLIASAATAMAGRRTFVHATRASSSSTDRAMHGTGRMPGP